MAQPAGARELELKVFISYSRSDLDFADQLVAALNAAGFDPTIDRQSISGGEEWKHRLAALIRDCDTVAFVLSPASAGSEICAWEVEEAVRLGKRILPVVCRPLVGISAPRRLKDLNYIHFYRDSDFPGSGFGFGLERLVDALNMNTEWIREHTRLMRLATEWDQGGRRDNRLLTGGDIAAAKAWSARRATDAPEPTSLQLDFIRASEEAEGRQLSTERQRLEHMAAVQAEREAALKEKELAQALEAAASRRVVHRTVAGLVVAVVLALAASGAGLYAFNERKIALQHESRAQERLLLAIETAHNFATETGTLAQRAAMPPDVILALLEPAERTLLKLDDGRSDDSTLHSTIALTSLQVGRSYRLIGKRDSWRTRTEEAETRLRDKLRSKPGDTLLQRTLATVLQEIAETHRDRGDPTRSLQMLSEVVELQEAIAKSNPTDIRIKRELASSYTAIAESYRLQDAYEMALEYFIRALDIRRSVLALDPKNNSALLELSVAHIGVGAIRHEYEDFDAALESYREARLIRERLIEGQPDNPTYRRFLSWALSVEVELLHEKGEHAAATALHKLLLELRRSNHEAVPSNEIYKRDLAWAHLTVSDGLRTAGRMAQAESEIASSVKLFTELLASNPEDGGKRRNLGWALRHNGYLLMVRRSDREALAALQRARELLETATAQVPANLHWRYEYGVTLSDLGYVHLLMDDRPAADRTLKESQRTFASIPDRRLQRAESRRIRSELERRAALAAAQPEAVATER